MPESQNTEYKQTWRDETLKWISGFANAEGGVLVIGRDDAGAVVGVKDAKKLLEDIPNKVRDILGILVAVNLCVEGELEYLEITVEPYPNPISHKGKYYLRSGSTLQELKGAALDRFILRAQGKTWDGVPVPYVSIADLSPQLIERFREKARRSGRVSSSDLQASDAALIEKLKLTEGDYLKRAALLLFHPSPDRFASGAFLKIGYFRSESDLAYHDEVQGGLFSQVDQAVDLILTKYFKAAISYDGMQRVESYPVPEAALREALLNAIVHRDYGIHAPIQIRIYADHMKIWNPAVLPDGWDLKKLLGEHASHPFNPDIANAFFRAGEIETWGRGIQRIFAACKVAGSPKPKVRYEPNDLWMEFPFSPEYLKVIGEGSETKLDEKVGEKAVKEGEKLGDRLDDRLDEKLDEKLGENRAKIIRRLRENPKMTVTALSEYLEISRNAVHNNIKILNKTGWIKRIGPAKGGHWEVLK